MGTICYLLLDKPLGKGITYDTGGLNLKPTGSMEEMHMDCSGAAAVLGAIRTVAELKLPINIGAVCTIAENAIGPKSYKPYAIIETVRGSVQVDNTDAEGRLALADAFLHAQSSFKPEQMVDIATLTGACMMALGTELAGVFANDDDLASELIDCGVEVHERCWQMPVLPEHDQAIKGDETDILSCGKGRTAGASKAAAFLQRFVGPNDDNNNNDDDQDDDQDDDDQDDNNNDNHNDINNNNNNNNDNTNNNKVRWAHLDIAGPAMMDAEKEWIPKGGTGFGAQLLAAFVSRQVQKVESHKN